MGKFKIKGSGDNFRFNLHAGNGEIIGTATQGYSSRSACVKGIESVKKNSVADIIDTTAGDEGKGSRFEIYKSKDGFRFRLIAANGNKILASEGYTTKRACQNGIDSVKRNATESPILDEEEK
ncbi:MAG: YegP family protein [Lachnospirales bacterium]